jgi:Zn-dependent M28 family amino/carboxypeptidase
MIALLFVAGCGTDEAARGLEAITAETLDAHLRFLASDQLEGRGPGTRGSELAARYISAQFELAGLEPAVGDSSFFQPVELIRALPRPRLSLRAPGGASLEPAYGTEYVGWSGTPVESADVVGELVFVGYGISAPERGWDDYKDQDVSGRVLLFLVNDPGQGAPGRFSGDTLTYYGRWTYKLEEAARRGAAGALLIHTRESAGYGWNVIQSSAAGERIVLEPVPGIQGLGFEGWVSREMAEQVISMAGLDFATLMESARSENFRPIPTGVTVTASDRGRIERFADANVAGLLRGSDPQLGDEVVVFTAHYDGHGVGTPVDSDSIYNGAYDNASGTALLISLAEAFARLPQQPSRSILFLAVTAEESGLLGSRYYTQHPLIPLARTVANINMDGANLWGRTEDAVVLGVQGSSLEATATEAAEAEGLSLTGDRAPEQGYVYRSDHLVFMNAGVPAAYVNHGLAYIGRLPEWGLRMHREYNERHYHQPSDEYRPDFDLGGAVQQCRVAFRMGLSVANAASRPTWKAGSEFSGGDGP